MGVLNVLKELKELGAGIGAGFVGVGRGATGDLIAYPAAVLNAMVNPDQTRSISQRIDDAKASYRNLEQAHPKSTMAGQVVGSVLPATGAAKLLVPAAGAGSKIGMQALVGAGTGAAQNFTNVNGDPDASVVNGALTGAAGGAIGEVVPRALLGTAKGAIKKYQVMKDANKYMGVLDGDLRRFIDNKVEVRDSKGNLQEISRNKLTAQELQDGVKVDKYGIPHEVVIPNPEPAQRAIAAAKASPGGFTQKSYHKALRTEAKNYLNAGTDEKVADRIWRGNRPGVGHANEWSNRLDASNLTSSGLGGLGAYALGQQYDQENAHLYALGGAVLSGLGGKVLNNLAPHVGERVASKVMGLSVPAGTGGIGAGAANVANQPKDQWASDFNQDFNQDDWSEFQDSSEPVQIQPAKQEESAPVKVDNSTSAPDSEWSDFTSPTPLHASTAQVESNNSDTAVSPVGAKGRMQTMPSTLTDPGFGVTPAKNDSPEELTRVGNDYLTAMLTRYGGDERKALAAYNAGPGKVDKLIKKYGANWEQHLPQETKKYIPNVLAGLN